MVGRESAVGHCGQAKKPQTKLFGYIEKP